MTTDEMILSIYNDLQNIKETVDKLDEEINILQVKRDIDSRNLDDLTFRAATVDHIMKKGFKQTDDQIEPLIAVMEAKGIFPKVE